MVWPAKQLFFLSHLDGAKQKLSAAVNGLARAAPGGQCILVVCLQPVDIGHRLSVMLHCDGSGPDVKIMLHSPPFYSLNVGCAKQKLPLADFWDLFFVVNSVIKLSRRRSQTAPSVKVGVILSVCCPERLSSCRLSADPSVESWGCPLVCCPRGCWSVILSFLLLQWVGTSLVLLKTSVCKSSTSGRGAPTSPWAASCMGRVTRLSLGCFTRDRHQSYSVAVCCTAASTTQSLSLQDLWQPEYSKEILVVQLLH